MQICLLSKADAQRIQDADFVPDCRSHDHLSKPDAHQAAADGKVRFVSSRAVVAVSSAPLSGYFYDRAVSNNDRYLGTAKSGPVHTIQLLKFMPGGRKRRVKHVGECGAHGRSTSARAVNAPSLSNQLQRSSGGDEELVGSSEKSGRRETPIDWGIDAELEESIGDSPKLSPVGEKGRPQ